ncbi:TPA: DMT family transporter [Klebsiella pneumoniae]
MDKSAPGPWSGWLHGLLGVIIFSGSLPATRLAVQDMDPLLLTFLRASIAGLLAVALLVQPASWHAISASSWVALGYVSLFSMLIGFIFWYKGLAAGGIAAVGQLQLLQPFFGLGLSAALLHETVSPLMLAVTLGVVLCVVGSRKFGRQRVGAGSGGNN